MVQTPKHRDIFYADLEPHVGSEQGGIRPVLIISNNAGNKYGSTVIVACISSKAYCKSFSRTHYEIHKYEEKGLKFPSVVMLEQIKTIDKARLMEYKGSLNKAEMFSVYGRILISLGMGKSYKRVHKNVKK